MGEKKTNDPRIGVYQAKDQWVEVTPYTRLFYDADGLVHAIASKCPNLDSAQDVAMRFHGAPFDIQEWGDFTPSGGGPDETCWGTVAFEWEGDWSFAQIVGWACSKCGHPCDGYHRGANR